MRYFTTCFIGLYFCLSVKAQSKQEAYIPAATTLKKLKETQLKADFETIQHALVETYGGIYRIADSINVQKRFDRYHKQLATIHNQADYISLLTTLIASFREGHMKVEYDDDTNNLLNNTRLFPFTVMVENEKLMVLYNETGNDQTITPGMEVLNINRYSAKHFIKLMMPHISADGYGNAHRKKRLADKFPQNLWLYFGQQEEFIIKAKDSKGKVVIRTVAGVTDAQRQA
ncbi:MAG: hypothetical protein EOP48_07865, partial [Sphingobacteriales bacterium]